MQTTLFIQLTPEEIDILNDIYLIESFSHSKQQEVKENDAIQMWTQA